MSNNYSTKNNEHRTTNTSMFRFSYTVFAVQYLLCATTVFAQVPKLIRYQGQTIDAKGVPLEGPYTLTFRLYDAETAGTKLWEEIQNSVPLSGGHFSVLLGQKTPLTTMDWREPCWLSVQVNNEPELAPRQRITSVPLAIRAETAEIVKTSDLTDDVSRLVPSGAVMLWTGASCPVGYTRLYTLDGKFLVSGAGFNGNAGGQDSVSVTTSPAGVHAHSISGTTSSASGTSCGWNASKGCGGSNPTDAAQLQHTHSAGSLTANAAGDHSHSVSFDNRPAFATVLLCQKD